MDALCELHLVRRITSQVHNFSALINDAPCTVPFAVQFTLCMVGFQQAADGKVLSAFSASVIVLTVQQWALSFHNFTL